jgi:hypothetical protein
MTCTDFERYRDMPGAALAALRLRRAFPSTTGGIGLGLAVQPLARRTWSISAWETEHHLRDFLASPAHIAPVRRYRARVRVESTISTVERFDARRVWRAPHTPTPRD